MLTAPGALRLAVPLGRAGAAPALERTHALLPPGPPAGTRDASLARAIVFSLVARNRLPAESGRKEIETLLGEPLPPAGPAADGPEALAAIAAVAARHVVEDSFEARALALGVAVAKLYVAARTADAAGIVLELIDGTSREALAARHRSALDAITAARTRVGAAGAAFDEACGSRPLSPAVSRAVGRVVEAANAPLPAFDAPGSHRAYDYQSWHQPDWRLPGQKFWNALPKAIDGLVEAFTFPEEARSLPPPSPAEAEALVALLALPDDDDARLRWAELADARRDPRALLVIEQMAVREKRRKRPYSGHVDSPLARSLVERHTEWAEPVLALGARDVTFRRGFVERITIEAWIFLGRAPALYAAAPILHVKLLGAGPLLPHLLESGFLSRLLSLDLSAQGLDDAHVERLARAGGLRSLRALDLRGNRITEAGAQALYTSTSLPALVCAPLDGNPCGPLHTEVPWDDGMPPSETWETTPLGARLGAEGGARRWAFPWASEWPPDLDVLTVLP